jgi:predicted DNA-binding ribbon-helix-helix protein
LREIAGRENISLSTLVGKIDRERNSCNLSSAIRVHVFNYFRAHTGQLEKQTKPAERQHSAADTLENGVLRARPGV